METCVSKVFWVIIICFKNLRLTLQMVTKLSSQYHFDNQTSKRTILAIKLWSKFNVPTPFNLVVKLDGMKRCAKGFPLGFIRNI